ncbi:Nef-associated protein 1 [Striga asiatica]|uniref:Nef-associated protein 1 n=1 Tax=Striga asiatica TaxID=4170 RepID=A0A5A7RIC6_STRAF|nr:Nef-associated protein 1 [Striga asiatica]
MEMKMDKFFERIKDLVFQSKDSPSTRATYDGTIVDEEVDLENNQQDTETARTVDDVEEKVGVHDDVGLEMRAKDKIVLVEDKFSEEVVSSKKNEHGFDTRHQKKRKAAVRLTPWRNPGKRQKIPTVTKYDPHRTLDEAKHEDLKVWLVNSPERYVFALS